MITELNKRCRIYEAAIQSVDKTRGVVWQYDTDSDTLRWVITQYTGKDGYNELAPVNESTLQDVISTAIMLGKF